MGRHTLLASIVVVALAAGAPPALAQTALNATFTAKIGAGIGPNGHLVGPNAHAVTCPDDAFTCGSGTDVSFGPFSWAAVPTDVGATTSLTFATGTLVIDETVQAVTAPGQSLFRSEHSVGNPLNVLFSWSVDPASSGSFDGATGSGTDAWDIAGFQLDGVTAGLINLQ
jgi:hypothetical protein